MDNLSFLLDREAHVSIAFPGPRDLPVDGVQRNAGGQRHLHLSGICQRKILQNKDGSDIRPFFNISGIRPDIKISILILNKDGKKLVSGRISRIRLFTIAEHPANLVSSPFKK